VNRFDDSHFRQFASSLEAAIARYDQPDDVDFLKLQKSQVEELVATEREFRKVLIAHSLGDKMYRAFIEYICDEKRNILAARPFFRERQGVFTDAISEALKARSVKKLQKFNFNFHFIQFVLGSNDWKPRSRLVLIAQRVSEIREELVTMNMPLAISRARIFYSRTPRAHLEYMDLVQISCEGLMSAIDKFVPPYTRAFRSTAIGRMTGNFIENYSETLIHFYPVDKRKIYRANKLLRRQTEGMDMTRLTTMVNDGVDSPGLTNPTELAGLLAAQSCVSTDQPLSEGEEEVRVQDRFAAPVECQPDVICEKMNTYRSLNAAIETLSVLDKKILTLKGVSL
jgi:RNA polymerase sigma factor (sigma-70 family)